MKVQDFFISQMVLFRLIPMEVREFRTFEDGYTYAVCPRCQLTMEREYVHYCNNCGQNLDWRGYEDSSIETE